VQKKCIFPLEVSVFEQTSGRLISHFGHIVQKVFGFVVFFIGFFVVGISFSPLLFLIR
jgi:hypothetical protein